MTVLLNSNPNYHLRVIASNQDHIQKCEDLDGGICEFLVEFYSCCENCGKIMQTESPDWVGLFEDENNQLGGCMLFCSEKCKNR